MGGALPPIFSTGMKRISLAILGRERTRRPGSPPAQGRAAEHGVGDTPIRTARARAQPTPVSRRPARDALPSEAAKTSSQPLEVSIPIVRRMLIFSSLFLWRPPRKAPAVQGPDALRGLQGGDPAEGRHPATPQPGRSSDRSVELTSARPGVRGLPYLYTRTVRPPRLSLTRFLLWSITRSRTTRGLRPHECVYSDHSLHTVFPREQVALECLQRARLPVCVSFK